MKHENITKYVQIYNYDKVCMHYSGGQWISGPGRIDLNFSLTIAEDRCPYPCNQSISVLIDAAYTTALIATQRKKSMLLNSKEQLARQPVHHTGCIVEQRHTRMHLSTFCIMDKHTMMLKSLFKYHILWHKLK